MTFQSENLHVIETNYMGGVGEGKTMNLGRNLNSQKNINVS